MTFSCSVLPNAGPHLPSSLSDRIGRLRPFRSLCQVGRKNLNNDGTFRQLWDNFWTTSRQFWDNFRTSLGQGIWCLRRFRSLCQVGCESEEFENKGTLRQIWENFGMTMRHLLDKGSDASVRQKISQMFEPHNFSSKCLFFAKMANQTEYFKNPLPAQPN